MQAALGGGELGGGGVGGGDGGGGGAVAMIVMFTRQVGIVMGLLPVTIPGSQPHA